MIHPLETIGDIRNPARELREQIPDVLAAYAAMQRAVIVDGALPARVKELIALGNRGHTGVRRLHRSSRPGRGAQGRNRGRGRRGVGGCRHDERWSRHGVGAARVRRLPRGDGSGAGRVGAGWAQGQGPVYAAVTLSESAGQA